MRIIRLFYPLLLVALFLFSCTEDPAKTKKLSKGVYEQNGWIYDLKELPSGKNVIPFFTVAKLSSNSLSNSFTKPPSEMGVMIYFGLDKQGDNKNKITSIFLESTATDESLFKFPRCLSVCPVNVEVKTASGGYEKLRSTYSRLNVFKMQMEDLDLAGFAIGGNEIRIRIPVSMNNQNTTFEWFDFDLSDFNPILNK